MIYKLSQRVYNIYFIHLTHSNRFLKFGFNRVCLFNSIIQLERLVNYVCTFFQPFSNHAHMHSTYATTVCITITSRDQRRIVSVNVPILFLQMFPMHKWVHRVEILGHMIPMQRVLVYKPLFSLVIQIVPHHVITLSTTQFTFLFTIIIVKHHDFRVTLNQIFFTLF